ncbi:thioredoxin domain-containing protein [Shewanella loihica]|uniref:DSBA oxidoreductase n=1 Tax=Shewanella loihica (strain ATCC BAA-1088 / PV-4) TaxID=323850 RepID=A3QDG3_SHELP|nr:thioredoxin domain-containing protein [Shewanella loihica]ABO23511.1 DSBA oxidoreductase [Shewanella loihica PV-4]
MPSTHSTVIVCLSLLFFTAACQQKNDDKLEKELAYLKQEMGQLKQQVAIMGSQVKEIHTIAMKSQEPQHRSLPTQINPGEDGKLPALGEATAQVAIIEFSDYQCPYCKRYMDNTFTKIKSDYIDTGKVKYIARDFPLGFHPKAKGAAIAANCSLQQDAYWPMRDALFKNMRQLGDKLYQDTATQLSLDMTKFAACLEDQAIMSKIEQDIGYGSSIGVRGTPSFLIGKLENNRLIEPKLVVGAQSYDTFKAVIDALEKPTQTN